MGERSRAIRLLTMAPKPMVRGVVPDAVVGPFRCRVTVLAGCYCRDAEENDIKRGLEKRSTSIILCGQSGNLEVGDIDLA